MMQSTQMLVATVGGFGAVGVLAVTTVTLCWPRRTPEPAPLPVLVLGYRYCPDEQRTRAAVQHADGTATCGDCHAHIPAGGQ